jgi:hypothetical protein
MGYSSPISRNNRKGEPIMIRTATIGKGKAIHALVDTDRTRCMGNVNDFSKALPVECDATEVTCKKCLKALAAEVEQAHAEAIQADEERAIYRAANSIESRVVVEVDSNAAHIEALEMDSERERAHVAALNVADDHHWVSHADGSWRSRDRVLRLCDVVTSRETRTHAGPCYDSVASVWREEPTAPKRSRRQGRAERRGLRVKLREMAPQTRAAARARRTHRGTARATVRTPLVAVGVPQDVRARVSVAA